MKSLAELAAIRDKMKDKVALREGQTLDPSGRALYPIGKCQQTHCNNLFSLCSNHRKQNWKRCV